MYKRSPAAVPVPATPAGAVVLVHWAQVGKNPATLKVVEPPQVIEDDGEAVGVPRVG